MAVRMRLKRMGAKKRPFYRLVVADSRSPRDGRIIESLGYYNPLTDPVTIVVDEEKTKTWLGQGAQPSETVRRLLKVAGVLPGGNGAQAASEDNGAEEAQSEGEVS